VGGGGGDNGDKGFFANLCCVFPASMSSSSLVFLQWYAAAVLAFDGPGFSRPGEARLLM
jgi:hypothetical protein